MVAVHMGQDHGVDLVGAIARSGQSGGDPGGVEAGVNRISSDPVLTTVG